MIYFDVINKTGGAPDIGNAAFILNEFVKNMGENMSVKIGLKYIDIWNDSMEQAVCEYEKEEIKTGGIVFYGPSNFTRWGEKYGHRPLKDDLLGSSGAQCCINRGFGSSCPEHQLYYYHRMIRPLAPKVLVYSPFGNSRAFGYTTEATFELAQRVVA